MQLAPQIEMTGTPATLSDGMAGIFQTVRCMRDIVTEYRTHSDIRQAAASIVFLTPEKDDLHECTAIFNTVRDNIRYLRDILNVETIATPDKTLLCQYGDCDDQSILCAALFESIGYPTRFICAGYNFPEVLEHVYLQVLAGGQWINCDPTEHYPIGYAPPGAVCLYVERVKC